MLFEAWRVDPLARHRVWACELVEKFSDPAGAVALEALRADRDGHVRDAANRALRTLGDRERFGDEVLKLQRLHLEAIEKVSDEARSRALHTNLWLLVLLLIVVGFGLHPHC